MDVETMSWNEFKAHCSPTVQTHGGLTPLSIAHRVLHERFPAYDLGFDRSKKWVIIFQGFEHRPEIVARFPKTDLDSAEDPWDYVERLITSRTDMKQMAQGVDTKEMIKQVKNLPDGPVKKMLAAKLRINL